MDTSTIERDNAQALHALTAPFRWLRNLIVFAFTLLFILVVFTYNSLFWVVGLGSMGWIDRQELADQMLLTDSDGRGDFSDYSLNFQRRILAPPVEKSDYSDYPFFIWTQTGSRNFIHDYCSPKALSEDGGTRPSGWFNRGRTALDRKSARMREAFIRASIAAAALNNMLTNLKLHRAADAGFVYDMSAINAICNSTPYEDRSLEYGGLRWTEVSTEFANLWQNTSGLIALPDAPDIDIRFVESGFSRVPEVNESHSMVSGVALSPSDPEYDTTLVGDGLRFYITKYADLFEETPPLSVAQTRAIDRLNHMMDREFWLKEAHANRIRNDQAVLAVWERTSAMVKAADRPNRAPQATIGTVFTGSD